MSYRSLDGDFTMVSI